MQLAQLVVRVTCRLSGCWSKWKQFQTTNVQLIFGCAGLSAEKQLDGSYKVWVHIADPTRWLGPPGSPLDQEAALRAKTVYLPTGQPPTLGLLHPLTR